MAWPRPDNSLRGACLHSLSQKRHLPEFTVLPLLGLRPGIVSGAVFRCPFGDAVARGSCCWAIAPRPAACIPGGARPLSSEYGNFLGGADNGVYLVEERPLMLGTGVQVVLTMAGCLAGAGVVDRVGGRISKALLANPLSLFTASRRAPAGLADPLRPLPHCPDARCLGFYGGAARNSLGGRHRRARTVRCLLRWVDARLVRIELGPLGLGPRPPARGIAADDIEGGLEWDSWHAPGQVGPTGRFTLLRGSRYASTISGTLRITANRLSFSPVPGGAVSIPSPIPCGLSPVHGNPVSRAERMPDEIAKGIQFDGRARRPQRTGRGARAREERAGASRRPDPSIEIRLWWLP